MMLEEMDDGKLQFWCSLCDARLADTMTAVDHLEGEKHSKRCKKCGYPELLHNKEKDRLEELDTGKVVERPDAAAILAGTPWGDGEQERCPAVAEAPGAAPLPRTEAQAQHDP